MYYLSKSIISFFYFEISFVMFTEKVLVKKVPFFISHLKGIILLNIFDCFSHLSMGELNLTCCKMMKSYQRLLENESNQTLQL